MRARDISSPCDICQTPSCKRCLAPPHFDESTGVFKCSACTGAPKENCRDCSDIDQEEETLLRESGLTFCRNGCYAKAVQLARHEKLTAQ
jgi:hypothetical protein